MRTFTVFEACYYRTPPETASVTLRVVDAKWRELGRLEVDLAFVDVSQGMSELWSFCDLVVPCHKAGVCWGVTIELASFPGKQSILQAPGLEGIRVQPGWTVPLAITGPMLTHQWDE